MGSEMCIRDRAMIQDLQERKFGDNYQQLVEIRDFLNTLENRSEAIAFVLSDDPLKS